MKNTTMSGLVVGTLAGAFLIFNEPNLYDSISILEKSRNTYKELTSITESIYTDFYPARRSTVIVYNATNSPHSNIGQVRATLVAETKADDRESLFSSYKNLVINTGNDYYRDFLQGKCSTIGTEELGVVDDSKRDLEVFAISCPIFAPYLIGEVSIAFDAEYPLTSSVGIIEDRLREEAINISILLEENNE